MPLPKLHFTKTALKVWLISLAFWNIPTVANAQQNVPYRLLIPLLQPFPIPGATTQLHVGPDIPDLPIELPLPASGVYRWAMGADYYHLLFFEVAGERSQTEAQYLELLQQSGWERWIPPEPEASEESNTELNSEGAILIGPIISFGRPSELQPEPQLFCHQDDNTQLFFNTFKGSLNTTKLSVSLIFGESGSRCSFNADERFEPTPPLSESSDFVERIQELLLTPPGDTQIELLDKNIDTDYIATQLKIETSLSLEALKAHYSTEMQQQGWTLQSESNQERLQWSMWSQAEGEDDHQQAMVSLFATEDTGQYLGIFSQRTPSQQSFWFDIPIAEIPDGGLPKSTALEILRDIGQLSDSDSIELWLNQLPPFFSNELPIPTETLILGGISDTVKDVAILETSLLPELVYEFYRESLAKTGWKSRENLWANSFDIGFESSRHSFLSFQLFCHVNGDDEILLQLPTYSRDLTTVYIERRAVGSLSPCQQEQQANIERYRSANPFTELNLPIPTLQKPSETVVRMSGSSASPINFSSNVYIRSQLTADRVVAHYSAQMRQAGWEEQAKAQADESVVSVWTTRDDEGDLWRAWLNLIAQTETNQWHGSLTISSEDSLKYRHTSPRDYFQ
ncbi:MAG: hypothetical protein AAGI69_17655 [Cyanobacteria bacterium P01_H01_bin.21]